MICFCFFRVDRVERICYHYHKYFRHRVSFHARWGLGAVPKYLSFSSATETEHPISAGINPPSINIVLPSLFAVRNDYVTKFWTMRYKQKCPVATSENLP